MNHSNDRTDRDDTIQFYIPDEPGRAGALPQSLDEYWTWIAKTSGVGEIGRYTWALKTYLYLRQTDVPCRLVTEFPDRGVVVSHRDFLPMILAPRADVFLVCIKPDRKAHPWAHCHVVQNTSDSIFRGRRSASARAIAHWPQPGLLPRDPARGARCERLGYFGRLMNLAPELQTDAWAAGLKEQGLEWLLVPSSRWNDYRDIDVTVSVRDWGSDAHAGDPLLDPNSKPPSKLINSWLAGVPAIVGKESAFRNVRESPLDFIEVVSLDELREALHELRHNAALYRSMAAHGLERARAFTDEAVLAQWTALFKEHVLPAYRDWLAHGLIVRQSRNLWNIASFAATPGQLPSLRLRGSAKR